jgi:hypothetical protein
MLDRGIAWLTQEVRFQHDRGLEASGCGSTWHGRRMGGGHLWAVWGLVRWPDHHYHVAYKDQLVW